MFRLTIDGQEYEFHFGMGFMREVNKLMSVPVDGIKDARKNIGLQYKAAEVVDGDVTALVELLFAANKGRKPRVNTDLLDAYIDDENTDVDQLFKEVLSFLETSNATKKTMETLNKAIKKQKEAEKKEAEAKEKAEKKEEKA